MDNRKHFIRCKNKGTNAIPRFTHVESNIDYVEKKPKSSARPAGSAKSCRKNFAAFAQNAPGLKPKRAGVSEKKRRPGTPGLKRSGSPPCSYAANAALSRVLHDVRIRVNLGLRNGKRDAQIRRLDDFRL